MSLIADILLIAGALAAAFYCYILGRRLRRFNDLEKGVGGAVAVLSAQVDDMNTTLDRAQISARTSAQSLTELTERAEGATKRLELLLASLHDLPEATEAPSRPIAAKMRPKPEPAEPKAPLPTPSQADVPEPEELAKTLFFRSRTGGAPQQAAE